MVAPLALAYLWHLLYIPQEYLLVPGHGCRSVVIYQLIQRIELHHPQEILPSPIAEHLEVLDIIPKPAEGRRGMKQPQGSPNPKVPRELLWLLELAGTTAAQLEMGTVPGASPRPLLTAGHSNNPHGGQVHPLSSL